MKLGKVFLVGGGPGDPGLITRKGAACLRNAEVVVYDRLISRELLYLVPPEAELVYVGKRTGGHVRTQDEINRLLIQKAREGKSVVRLKGGDPFVFGRGAEEMMELLDAGIPFEVVPGVTAAVAATAYAGIPLTHRDWTSSVVLVTGHAAANKENKEGQTVNWEGIARCAGTIVVYMGVKNLPTITSHIISAGRPPDTPCAVIQSGTTPWQRTVEGTLENISQRAHQQKIAPPALLVVGEVAKMRQHLAWHEVRPLFGRRLVVTRSRSRNNELAEELRSRGALVIEFPTVEFSPPLDSLSLYQSLAPLAQFHWILFFSPTGVRFFFKELMVKHGDIRNLGSSRIAVRDNSTAEELKHWGIKADLVSAHILSPSQVTRELMRLGLQAGDKVLIPHLVSGRPDIVRAISEIGASVRVCDVYSPVIPTQIPDMFIDLYEAGLLDGIIFTSSTAVKHFIKMLKVPSLATLSQKLHYFSMGPVTSREIESAGARVSAAASPHTRRALIETITSFYRQH